MVSAQRRLCALLGHVEASMVPRCALLEWRTVAADPVVADIEAVKRAVEHCNADHADAVLEMSRAFTGLSGIQKAVMLSIDQYGFDVLCETRAGPMRGRVLFQKTINSASLLREIMMETTQLARDKLAAQK
ncbi:unnamed protein product [Cladocopium goreaui]|uniref:DUF2470 domain-containing protein n=1 Tax=Cladocopium goreaui TaxID=2562237 RepID=A0A9P1GEB6_9DINO|nr:unnamed protein product [Cladocopium goreaui]